MVAVLMILIGLVVGTIGWVACAISAEATDHTSDWRSAGWIVLMLAGCVAFLVGVFTAGVGSIRLATFLWELSA